MVKPQLLSRRLVFVTGKGGVGKSTVATALGVLAAQRGKRAIVAEVSGRGDVPRLLGTSPAPEGVEVEVAPGLWSIAIDPQRAMEEYLRDQLPIPALAALLSGSRAFGYLTAATPGMRELLTVGKLWELAQPKRRARGTDPYDIVIVDAPATGHGIALLAAPRTFARVAQVGPIARQGKIIAATLAKRSVTAVVAVSTAQEPAVNETLELQARLKGELGLALHAVLINALHPWRFTLQEVRALKSARSELPAGPAVHALDVALAEESIVRSERAQLRRLREQTGGRGPELPFLFAPELGLSEIELLSAELDRWL